MPNGLWSSITFGVGTMLTACVFVSQTPKTNFSFIGVKRTLMQYLAHHPQYLPVNPEPEVVNSEGGTTMDGEVLSTEIISQSRSYRYVRRYLKGKHPEKGILHMGYTGWETIVETAIIIPVKVYTVQDKTTG